MQPGADEIDYRESADITKVHGAVRREHHEPEAGAIPVPFWLLSLVLLVTLSAGFYFGQFNGGFSATVFNEREGLASLGGDAAGGEGAATQAKVETLAEQGAKVFGANCASCHQANGQGLAGQYPPLAGSPWVNGPNKRVTMIVLKGLQGGVHGKEYSGVMAAWGTTLNNKRIAAVLSYIRSSWGNNAPEVTPEQVAAIRESVADRTDPYSEADLKDVNEDVPPPAPAP